jgi:acetyl-CoA carboxylase biotin carboxyl carrier protein
MPQRSPATLPGPEDAAEAARASESIPGPARSGRGEAAGQIEVTAPMVGTFYRAPSPDAPPFVEIGTSVQRGQALCLIEVMKLFTTIYAEQPGRVVQIGAQDGELVEYGRALFIIEPSS